MIAALVDFMLAYGWPAIGLCLGGLIFAVIVVGVQEIGAPLVARKEKK